MPQFTVSGEVIRTIAQDLGVRVENAGELREFWRNSEIDTKPDWFDQDEPVISISRQEDIVACKPGDQVSLTFVTEDRSNGKRGIKTVNFEVLSSAP